MKRVPTTVACTILRCTPRHVRNLVRSGYLTEYRGKGGRLLIDLDEIGEDTPRGRLDKDRPFPDYQS